MSTLSSAATAATAVAPAAGGGGGSLTLSGLLNAIDGVAAQEGRLLFMSSNFPERLPASLVRPGRVDVCVPFGLCTAAQARKFVRRFFARGDDDGDGDGDGDGRRAAPEGRERRRGGASSEAGAGATVGATGARTVEPSVGASGDNDDDGMRDDNGDEHERLAVAFGEVAAGQLTTAQLQGCVMLHSDAPRAALECCRRLVEEGAKHNNG